MTAIAFDSFANEYDRWFDLHPLAYQSEIEAIRRSIPLKGLGVEIGVGSGRFSTPFSITVGVDPSEPMATIARLRGITVHLARAEQLPFESGHFDFALMVTTLCFLENPRMALNEANRILKPSGLLIMAIIDKESQLGRAYEAMKSSNKFYAEATFFSTQQVLALLHQADFGQFQISQTIFSSPESMTALDPIRDGHGQGAFVVIRSKKYFKDSP